MSEYKLWLQIEKRLPNDEYENVGEPVDVACFPTLARARAAQVAMFEMADPAEAKRCKQAGCWPYPPVRRRRVRVSADGSVEEVPNA